MEKRTRRIGWTVVFLGCAFMIVASNPWETTQLRICRDCLAREHTISGFLSLTKKTSLERGEFADWFELRNPNHQHVWWSISKSGRGMVRVFTNYGRGQFGLISPNTILRLANHSPSDYERYRQMVLSNERSINNEAVGFSYEAERELERASAVVK